MVKHEKHGKSWKIMEKHEKTFKKSLWKIMEKTEKNTRQIMENMENDGKTFFKLFSRFKAKI